MGKVGLFLEDICFVAVRFSRRQPMHVDVDGSVRWAAG